MASLDEGVTADADSRVIPASSLKQKATETGPTFIVPQTTGQAQVVVRAFDCAHMACRSRHAHTAHRTGRIAHTLCGTEY